MSLPGGVPRPLKIGIGGPVGSGKTALVETLARRLREQLDMAVITNDIYTQEDAQFLVRRGALPRERVLLETDCPYLAPAPFRGKRCEPAHTRIVAESIATARNVPLEEIAEATSETAEKFFRFNRT